MHLKDQTDMLAKARDMLNRITGFSTPVFGVQWTPAASDRDAARRLLAFLEDRRALFNPFPSEIEDHVVSSVRGIREECVKTVGQMNDGAAGATHVRAIGAACRRFLDDPYPVFDDIAEARREPWMDRERHLHGLRRGTSPEAFFTALGELRAFVGVHIAALSHLYDIDVHGDLVRILPPPVEE